MGNKKKKIAIIGHFADGKDFFDGQTVKTKALHQSLQDTEKYSIYKVDTYDKKRNPVKLLWRTFICLFTRRDVFVLLSGGGMRVYFPLLYAASKLLKTRVYHDVIGGNLDVKIIENPKFRKYLNSFVVNWVETQGIKEKVEKLGVGNAEVLPNFKRLEAVPPTSEHSYVLTDGSYKFCTFSRVIAEKGITDAINAIVSINRTRGSIIAKLDIYGPIEENYQKEFDRLVEEHKGVVSYCGTVESNNSVQVLKDYFALLFPTRWDGEGFPGTVLDCYASAIPVIASDWNANKELIWHTKTGLIYPNEGFETLESSIEWAIDNKEKFDAMKKACREEYEKYTPEKIVDRINQKLLSKE